jgi:hypothetical protein
MSRTKLSLAGNTLIIPGPTGDGKIADLFLQCKEETTLMAPLSDHFFKNLSAIPCFFPPLHTPSLFTCDSSSKKSGDES